MNTSPQIDRLRGCLFGGAIGDTVGLFTEFLTAEHARELYGPNPRFSLTSRPLKDVPSPNSTNNLKWCHMDRHRALFEPSAWTDDTDQALLILLSFLRSGGKELDAKDFAKRLRFWMENGLRALQRPPLGVGRTVRSVVGSKGFLDDPFESAKKTWEATDRNMAANGAVMRTGIVGALVFQDTEGISGLDRTFRAAIDIASTTHADPRCLVSCAIASGLVCTIMRDELRSEQDIHAIVQKAVQFLNSHYSTDSQLSPEHLKELEEHVWTQSLESLKLDDSTTIGYTYKALGAGVYSLRQIMSQFPHSSLSSESSPNPNPNTKAENYERLITQLTMAGGDADTNCAVAGPLIGAWIGLSSLPDHWVRELKHGSWLLAKADTAGSLLGLVPKGSYTLIMGGREIQVMDYGSEGYDRERDTDTLFDAGKGAMSKEEVDAMWKVLCENLELRLNPQLVKRKVADNKCVIC